MNRVPANRYIAFAIIVCAGIICDLGSKHLIFKDLGYPGGGVHYKAGTHERFDRDPEKEGESRSYLDGWVQFRLFTSFNRGALWGVGQGKSQLFALASVAAIVGILVWLFWFAAAHSKWLTVALALVMSGTIGNLWDRLGMHGAVDLRGDVIYGVRDFFLFTFGEWNYPIFNFADIFLVTGAIMLVIQSLFFAEATTGEKTTEGSETADEAQSAEKTKAATNAA